MSQTHIARVTARYEDDGVALLERTLGQCRALHVRFVRCGPVGAVWTIENVRRGESVGAQAVEVDLAAADPHDVPLTAASLELPLPSARIARY